MHVYGEINGTLSGSGTLTGSVRSTGMLSGSLTVPSAAGVERYEGEYEFTPSGSEQTVEISGKMATRNIVINPIPSNYGLITWDGSTITVS